MKIEPKNRDKGLKSWVAWKLVSLAKRIYPESKDVKTFYMELLHDYMIEGKYIVRENWGDIINEAK